MLEERKRWWTPPKKVGIAVIVLILVVVVVGHAVNSESRKHSDNIYQQTSFADKPITFLKKITGQNKEKDSLKKSGTQTKPKDTGQPPENTTRPTVEPTVAPTSTPEEVMQVSTGKEEEINKEVKIVRNAEMYKEPNLKSDIAFRVKVGESIKVLREVEDYWLEAEYKGEIAYISYLKTDYTGNATGREIEIFSIGVSATVSKKEGDQFLREYPGMAAEGHYVTAGRTVEVLSREKVLKGEQKYWYYVRFTDDNSYGYLYNDNLVFEEKPVPTKTITTTPQPTNTAENSEETSSPQATTVTKVTETPTATGTSESKATEKPTATSTKTPEPKATEKPVVTAKPKQTAKLKNLIITTTKAQPMYEKPDDKARVICTVPEGGKIRNVREAAIGKEWLCGEVNGEIVFFPYLHTDYAEKAGKKAKTVKKYDKTTYAVVTGDGVNFRLAPGVTSKVTDCLPKGNRLKLIERKELMIGEKSGWYKAINLETGEIRYICGLYVKKVSSLDKKEEDRNTTSQEEEVTQSNNKTVVKKEEVISEDMIQVRDNVNKEVESEKKAKDAKKVKKTPKKETKSSKSFKGVTLKFKARYNVSKDPLTPTMGNKSFNGNIEAWYSQLKRPGKGLKIPGRHVADDGTIRDKDGFIVVAAHKDYLAYGTKLITSRGPAKVYDTGCARGIVDIYTNWKKGQVVK